MLLITPLESLAFFFFGIIGAILFLAYKMRQYARTAVYDDDYECGECEPESPQPQPHEEGIMKDILYPELSDVNLTKYKNGEVMFTNNHNSPVSFNPFLNR